MLMDYKPNPASTEDIVLPPDILALAEKLAENTHEVWAKGRVEEGWTYGPHRDDAQKKHPGLVPYGALSESEKEYDRRTALETLKMIILMGYGINRGENGERRLPLK